MSFMNLNGDEKRIRQLFREMSTEEQRRAPEFAAVIAAARSRSGRTQSSTRLFALACAVSALVIAILIGVSFATRYVKVRQPPEPDNQVAESQPLTQSAPAKPPSGKSVDTHRIVA